MGANIANEVAEEKFCETTIGMEDRWIFDKFNPRVRCLQLGNKIKIRHHQTGALSNPRFCLPT